MKKCYFCSEPATIHLTDVIQKVKHEWDLCDSCANKHHFFTTKNNDLNIPLVLQFIMEKLFPENLSDSENLTSPTLNQDLIALSLGEELSASITVKIQKSSDEKSERVSTAICSKCGFSLSHFRTQGRLGCPHDYEHFESFLSPILEKVHRKLIHVGKRPKSWQNDNPNGKSANNPSFLTEIAQNKAKILELKEQLNQAVAIEYFEEAAKIRDMIRDLEAKIATNSAKI